MRVIAFVVVLSLALLSTAALAEVPGQMNYQGTLTDSNGVAVDDIVSMTFRIYADSTGGSALWSETQSMGSSTFCWVESMLFPIWFFRIQHGGWGSRYLTIRRCSPGSGLRR